MTDPTCPICDEALLANLTDIVARYSGDVDMMGVTVAFRKALTHDQPQTDDMAAGHLDPERITAQAEYAEAFETHNCNPSMQTDDVREALALMATLLPLGGTRQREAHATLEATITRLTEQAAWDKATIEALQQTSEWTSEKEATITRLTAENAAKDAVVEAARALNVVSPLYLWDDRYGEHNTLIDLRDALAALDER